MVFYKLCFTDDDIMPTIKCDKECGSKCIEEKYDDGFCEEMICKCITFFDHGESWKITELKKKKRFFFF